MLRVEELMTTGVLSVRDTDLVEKADREMRLAEIRHLPVVDLHGRVVGVLSNRDVIAAMAVKGGEKRRIGSIMSRAVASVRPETPAHEAAAIMLDRKIGSLPVIDDSEALIGIVTETDFLSIAHQALRGRTGTDLLRI